MTKTTTKTECHRSLIAQLVKARLKSGFTQAVIAKRMHKSQTWIARVESGGRRVDVCEMIVFSRAVGADPMKILAAVLKAID